MLSKMLQPGERERYTTRRTHGTHAAGEECWVSRPEGAKYLRLDFDNGDVIRFAGHAAEVEEVVPFGGDATIMLAM